MQSYIFLIQNKQIQLNLLKKLQNLSKKIKVFIRMKFIHKYNFIRMSHTDEVTLTNELHPYERYKFINTWMKYIRMCKTQSYSRF